MKTPTLHRWNKIDSLVVCVCALGVFGLLHLANMRLNYIWSWSEPLSYIISVRDNGEWQAGLLLDGMLMSIRLLIFGGVFALVIGTLVAALALSPLPAARWMARLYVEGLRHLPPIVFMFIFFYFISTQAVFIWEFILAHTDNTIGRFLLGNPTLAENLISGVLCLAIFEAAFFSEIIRAGVLSIERGQWDAARSIGLSKVQCLRFIIAPQVLARTASPLVGQLILLIKNSAILSIISVQDLTFSAQETAVSTQQVFETWLITAAFYFILCFPLLRLAHHFKPQAA